MSIQHRVFLLVTLIPLFSSFALLSYQGYMLQHSRISSSLLLVGKVEAEKKSLCIYTTHLADCGDADKNCFVHKNLDKDISQFLNFIF